MNVSATNRQLETRPVAFNSVGVMDALFPLFGAVLDKAMLVAILGQIVVAPKLVSADCSAGNNMFGDVSQKSFGFNVWDNPCDDLAAALHHTEYAGFLGAYICGSAPNVVFATNVGFVNFNVARQIVVAVNLAHVLPDLVAHSPSSFVGDRQLALKLLSGDAMTGSSEQVDSVEPLLEGCTRACEGSSDHRANLMGAPLALIHRALAVLRKLAVFPALRAVQRVAIAHIHKVLKAGVIIWELLKKLQYTYLLVHLGFLLTWKLLYIYPVQESRG